MAKIRIDGRDYKVVESMGYVHDIGGYAKRVETPDGEKMAVKFATKWRFWTAEDRARPLREHLARQRRESSGD